MAETPNPLVNLQASYGTYVRELDGTDVNGKTLVVNGYTFTGYSDEDLYNRLTYTCQMLMGVTNQSFIFMDEIKKHPDKFPNADQLVNTIRAIVAEQIVKICDHFDKYVQSVMKIIVTAYNEHVSVPVWMPPELTEIRKDLGSNGFIAQAVEELRKNPEADYAYRKCKEWLRRLVPDLQS